MDRWQAWQSGMTPWQYRYKVAMAQSDTQYRDLYQRPHSLTRLLEVIENSSAEGLSVLQTPELRQFNNTLSRENELDRRLDRGCSRFLREGRYLALGFVEPRKPNDEPQFVPPDVWTEHHDWSSDRVSGNGLRMVAVRIVQAPIGEDARTRRPGRPSKRGQIYEVVRDLAAEGRVDFARSAKSQFELVRQEIWRRNPALRENVKGLSDQTLQKVFAEVRDQNGQSKL